jgi:outer membrane protein assembly factor BamB
MIALLVVTAWLALAGEPRNASHAWPQWGGPSRSFTTESPSLATSWPAGGPRRLWQRPLGDGYSAIVSDGATLYTVYRVEPEDVVIALDAATGRTKWESRFHAPFKELCSQRLGAAPRAAPLIAGERLVTVSAGGLMNSFNRQTGERLWSFDLLDGNAAGVRACGYAASPVAFEDLIITTAGGVGRGVVAVKAGTGALEWRSQDFENGYSSPLLIELDGRPEVVVFTYGEVSGLDPATGTLEWTVPHPADQGVNVSTPVWSPDNLLFVSSAYNGGSRVLRLSRKAGKVQVTQLWATERVRIHFGNAVRVGARIYASSGDFGAAPFAAIDMLTGDMLWRDRSVGRSSVIGADGKLIMLDEDGNLAIATPGESGLTLHAKAPVLEHTAWTVPTLCGTRLYLRDRKQILALELGATPAGGFD